MSENINYEEEILLNVRKIMRGIDMYSSWLARQYGLTTPQIICLKKLAQVEEIPPGSLAKAVNLSHATVTGIINRLEKKGLVERKRSTEDGRSFLISITESGLSMLQSAPSMLHEHLIMELSKLANWEKTLILSSLQRVTAMLSAEAIEVAAVLTTGPVEAPAESIKDFLGSNGKETCKDEDSKEKTEI